MTKAQEVYNELFPTTEEVRAELFPKMSRKELKWPKFEGGQVWITVDNEKFSSRF